MSEEKLSSEIIQSVSTVPGVVGFANSNVEKSPLLLKNFSAGVECFEVDGKWFVKAFIIVLQNISANIIVNEIENTIEEIFSRNKKEVQKIVVYIRGVK